MKSLNQYIQEKLIVNKDYRDASISPKSFDDLRKIIVDRYDELGSGTKENPIDFNDIDVSNIDSFCNDKGRGIFGSTKFKYIDISDWDVSNVESMRSMFSWCTELKSVGDISDWDVSNVTDMSCMFFYCQLLKSVGDLSGWDVSKVTDMNRMFCYCENFNQDLSNWDVSNVTNKHGIFFVCSIKNEYKPKF